MKTLNCDQVLSACSDGKNKQFKAAHSTVTFQCTGQGNSLKIQASWPENTKSLNIEQFKNRYHSQLFTLESINVSNKQEVSS